MGDARWSKKDKAWACTLDLLAHELGLDQPDPVEDRIELLSLMRLMDENGNLNTGAVYTLGRVVKAAYELGKKDAANET